MSAYSNNYGSVRDDYDYDYIQPCEYQKCEELPYNIAELTL
jgi:hypothetical protein